MTYKMKRSQVFIRPNLGVKFHTEIDETWFDRIKNTTKEFSDDCQVDMEYIGDQYLRVNFWLPDFEDYVRMTDCLYDKGQLKDVFKDAMRYSKNNHIGFAMPSWWLNKRTESGTYFKEWYTNKKTRTDSKFLEEIKNTLTDRITALKMYMQLEDCIMNSAVYDYTHTVKHSYFLYVKRDYETENKIDIIKSTCPMNYAYKRLFNEEQGVEFTWKQVYTNQLNVHDFHDIPDGIFSPEFKNLNIPIL